MAHMFASNIPNCEQDAVTLVIASAILVWLAKVSKRDRAIGCRDNFGEQNLFSRTSQNVSTTNTTL
jgi:hypothetical protein